MKSLLSCALAFLAAAASAQTPLATRVQPVSVAAPARGSVSGQLASTVFAAAEMSRGSFSVPSGMQAPNERGPLLGAPFPSYSPDGAMSEWGLGWNVNLQLVRSRLAGDLDYATDELTSPWGRCIRGTDGAWYPAGLQEQVRIEEVSANRFIARLPDGSRWTFGDTRTVVAQGTYAWQLTEVESVLGERTRYVWSANTSGRQFLQRVEWGGPSLSEYRLNLVYETLAKPFLDQRSGSTLVLDRRVKTVEVLARDATANALRLRYQYELGLRVDSGSPAFFLSSIQQRFAAGGLPPAMRFEYNLASEALTAAAARAVPKFDPILQAYGASLPMPDRSAVLDVNQDGLVDLESSTDQTLIVQTSTGYTSQPLPPVSPGAAPQCRPPAAGFNEPRMLAQLRQGDSQTQVVSLLAAGLSTQLTVCSREGQVLQQGLLPGNWELGPNTRLVDLDRDQQPDLVRVGAGSYTVLKNTSSATSFAFTAQPTKALSLGFQPEATWIHDFNGDGLADIVVRFQDELVVYLGKGKLEFDSTPRSWPFRGPGGIGFTSLNGRSVTFLDSNNDGLTDVLLSETGGMYLMLNDGSRFVERPTMALFALSQDNELPSFLDVDGSGNAEVFVSKLGRAYSVGLNVPGTALMRMADDGKGTVIRFTYGRGPAYAGQGYRNAVLATMQVETLGEGLRTASYEYAEPVVHSKARFLVGYRQVIRREGTLTETVRLEHADDHAGVLLETREQDSETPGIERVSFRRYADVVTRGISWRRVTHEGSGWVSGSQALFSTTEHVDYTDDVCPRTSVTTSLAGTRRAVNSYMTLPRFVGHLACITQSVQESGTHADASFDFENTVVYQRNAAGQTTRVTLTHPSTSLEVQSATYRPDGALASLTEAGRGTTLFTADALGRLEFITGPDGVVQRVSERDAVSDAVRAISIDRGAGLWTQRFRYDDQERLERTWSSAGNASEFMPNDQYRYAFATATTPGSISNLQLVDGSASIARSEIELMTGAGNSITVADKHAGGWTFSDVLVRTSSQNRVTRLLRGNLPATTLPSSLTFAALQAGALEQGEAVSSHFGHDAQNFVMMHANVARKLRSSLKLSGTALWLTTNENDARETRRRFDETQQVLERVTETGRSYVYRYDVRGRLREVQLPDGAKHRVGYDVLGRISRIERTGIATVQYAYSASTGLETSRTYSTPGGVAVRRVDLGYDAQGRVTSSTATALATGEVETFRFYFDGRTPTQTTTLDARGLLTAVTGPGYSKRFRYRIDGQRTYEELDLSGFRRIARTATYLDDGTVGSQRTQVFSASGSLMSDDTWAFPRDSYGQPAGVNVNGSKLATYEYDEFGRISGGSLKGGTTVKVSYDAYTRRVTGLAFNTGTYKTFMSQELDDRGLPAYEPMEISGKSLDQKYRYTEDGFLSSSSDHHYTYGESGLTTAIDGQAITQSGSVITAAGVQYQLDGLGRTVRRGTLEFSYGASGNLQRARRGSTDWTFVTDEAGERLLKKENGVPVLAWLDDGVLDATGLVQRVPMGSFIVAVRDHGVLRPLATDLRGSVLAEQDGRPNVASPYGDRKARADLSTAVDYVKSGFDDDLGALRMGARDFDPEVNRFLTPDPLMLEQPEMCVERPDECNLYGYVANRPLDRVDPTGLAGVGACYEPKPDPCATNRCFKATPKAEVAANRVLEGAIEYHEMKDALEGRRPYLYSVPPGELRNATHAYENYAAAVSAPPPPSTTPPVTLVHAGERTTNPAQTQTLKEGAAVETMSRAPGMLTRLRDAFGRAGRPFAFLLSLQAGSSRYVKAEEAANQRRNASEQVQPAAPGTRPPPPPPPRPRAPTPTTRPARRAK